MDDNNSDFPKDLDDDDEEIEYEVGYGKPPKHTQFQKGKSGNRKGRPKGVRNKPKGLAAKILNELIIKEGMREITIQEGSNRQKVTMIEASIKSLAMKAVKGDHRSHKLLLELYGNAEKCETDLKQAFFEEAVWFKKCAIEELEEAKEQGLPEPDIIPHPYHIRIEPRAGEAKIVGPLCENDKIFWDKWLARKLGWLDEIAEIDQILESGIEPFDGSKLCKIGREGYEHDREYLLRLVNIVCKLIPDDYYIPPSTRQYLESKPNIWNFND